MDGIFRSPSFFKKTPVINNLTISILVVMKTIKGG